MIIKKIVVVLNFIAIDKIYSIYCLFLGSQEIPALLLEDLPSCRPRYLVCEGHSPNLLEWSNLQVKRVNM